MAIRVALHHKTTYEYDRLVNIGSHEVRLRPAVHTRTPVLAYSLSVEPETHFINWQQDPYGNYIARLTFPKPAKKLEFTIDLIVDISVINPFDFFVESYAEHYPFKYAKQLYNDLQPYLKPDVGGPTFTKWLNALRREHIKPEVQINDFLVSINRAVYEHIKYLVRLEPGVQTPEQTLSKTSGSCRDSAWLLVQVFRQLGLAARFVSGYLIQLSSDVKALDGPSGPENDFTDLHAWTEVYLPGAGWIGLDPTSGLLAGEGHIPLACTASPSSAAPIMGMVDLAKVEFHHEMKVTRIHEDPRVTKPYTETQWSTIEQLGHQVDADLMRMDVRLTQGGEPTFVSIDDMDGPEWNIEAHGENKRKQAGQLHERLKAHFAPNGLLHYGQGKWYPGEPLPRWALNIYWRADGQPIWEDQSLFANDEESSGYDKQHAECFAKQLVNLLGLDSASLIPAYEDILQHLLLEAKLPHNISPHAADLSSSDGRAKLLQSIAKDLGTVVGFVLPIKANDAHLPENHKDYISVNVHRWRSSKWPLRSEHLYLTQGDSPMGLRLPLASLPWVLPDEIEPEFAVDPFAPLSPLPKTASGKTASAPAKELASNPAAREVIHTALCVEVREGQLYIFMPPLPRIEDYLALVTAVERTAAQLTLKVRLEGYPPPRDSRIKVLSVTPDPGVIEVNIHPSANWPELVHNTNTLYAEARLTRLGTEKFMLDGRHTGTGGGNHITLGGVTAMDSPMLRRPDVLKSLISYWQNHPALSYLFSGTFIGPTSQAPRVDEARNDSLYELAIAFQQMDQVLPYCAENDRPWLVDRLLRNILVDLTGNTHRAEFSIDKLYSPDGPTGRLGIVEFRAFEMPPHPQMALLQSLLLRALVARFWQNPYQGKLVHWGTQLHDRWMLPHFIEQDIADVVRDLVDAGYAFAKQWFDPFIEFRFPRYGTVVHKGIELELRQGIEPWHVMGEEVSQGGTSRYVDSSVERMQIRVRGLTEQRHVICCNGRRVPLHPTGVPGEFVAGIRYRAWQPWSALHPCIPVHAPLTFDIVDTWNKRSIGGCTYFVAHPGGRGYETFPVNANEAEARRFSRFVPHHHSPGEIVMREETLNPSFPFTLDLRWQASQS